MKLLVIGIDALSPNLLYSDLDKYPNIKKLVVNGVSGEYDGYVYGYGSRDNWISLYTGMEPKEHKVINNTYQPSGKQPRLYDYNDKDPFWKVLNDKGVKVGLWKALSSSPPMPIKGYMVAGEPAFDSLYEDYEIVSEGPMVCDKDKELLKVIKGTYPKHPTPRSPESFGYTWADIFESPEILHKILDDDYFLEGLDYLSAVLDYSLDNIKRVNEENPVELFWFYDSIFDYLGHFQMHDKNRKVMSKAIEKVDDFIGKLVTVLNPENIILLSDHGQQSLIDFFPNSDIKLQKEAFGLADQSIFLGDNIILKARNGGFMSAIHSLKATIIMSGDDFSKGSITDMRNLDFYPTLLELFDCLVPENRKGFVQPVYKKEIYTNECKRFPKRKRIRILLVQTCEVSEFNRFINDIYNEYRFSDIFVYGEKRYKDIFLVNPQVNDFICSEENIKVDEYEKVFISFYNNKTKESFIYNIKG